jgi:outer membrane protein assembly factor BamB
MTGRNRSRTVCALLLVLSGACASAPAAFGARFPDNVDHALTSMVQRVSAAPARNPLPIAVGVSSTNQLYAYDLAGRRVLWQAQSQPRFAPLLAGSLVVIQEGKRVVGLDLKTGVSRFQFDTAGMNLVGADGEGDAAVITLGSGQGTFAKARVVFISGGARAWTRELNFPVGVPALVGGVVLIPWSNQYLSGLEASSGNEFARLRTREGVISHAFVSGGHVYAGSEHGIAELSRDIVATNLTAGPHYAPPQQELPGRPFFLRDAYSSTPLPAAESAQNRVRLTWRPELASAQTVTLAGGNLYLVFYRFLFALDPKDLSLHWVYTHEVDLVGARAQADGILVADARGQLRYLSAASGATLWQEQNAPPSLDLEFPGDQSAVGSGSHPTMAQIDLRKQLAAAAQDADSRLVPVRLLAVQLLAQLPDPAATQDLLALCEDDRTTIAIRKAACNALRERKTGNEHVLAALARHASFLAGTSAPPVGALAKAAATENEVRAAPLLIAHLQDPGTPTPGLPEVVQALGDLKDPSVAAALAEFLLLYHADPVDEHLAHALELVPDALVKLQGEQARPALLRVAEDSLGAGGTQDAARKALVKLDAQAKATEQGSAPAAASAEPAAPPPPERPRPPAHITVDIINQALLPVHDRLQACIRDAQPEQFQARVVLVIEDGQVLMVSVLPEQLQSCIEPLIRKQPFPITQASQRERISYTIKRF